MSSAACGTPSAGSKRRAHPPRLQETVRAAWSSSTKPSSAGSRVPSPLYRAGHARIDGRRPADVEHARRALELVPEDDHVGRGGAAALLGLGYWTNGDLDAAYRSYREAMASLERGGHLADVVGGSIALGDLLIAQGRLDDAMRTYERALRLAPSRAGHRCGERRTCTLG